MANLRVTALCAFSALHVACAGELDNDLPKNKQDVALEERLGELEKDVSAAEAENRQQAQGARLTNKTIGETNEYLTELYQNINDTRPEDLPEWQDMYTALTDDKAMHDPAYGLGPRNLTTNFHKLKTLNDDNAADIRAISKDLDANTKVDEQQTKSLDLIMERLATIDRNIKNLNSAVEKKFKDVDKTLADYDGRIVGIENRMKTLEVDVDAFRQEFVSYKQRVTNIEELLRRYDLATMHNDIRNLKETVANHDERLIDILGRVQINASEISNVRNDLMDAEQELSGVSSEVGSLKAGVNEIFLRLDNCGCI